MRIMTIQLISFLICCYSAYCTPGNQSEEFSASDFVENKGQICDQNRIYNQDIKFLYSSKNFKIQLKSNSFSYEVLNSTNGELSTPFQKISDDKRKNCGIVYYSHRVDITLPGANPNPVIIAEGKSNDYENFYYEYTPADGVKYVYSYNTVIYKNIHPNIDLVFKSLNDSKNGVKYEFVVNPGGNPDNIKLAFEGQNELKLINNQTLLIKTFQGEIEETIPMCYTISAQGIKTQVQGSFSLSGNIATFNLADYDKKLTLVIDPVPQKIWGTYCGGSGVDGSDNISTDGSGYIFISGQTESNSSIASSGAHQVTYGGNSDAVLAKFNSNGQREWATYYGGSGQEYSAWCIYTSGNCYLFGETSSSSGISTNGSFQENYSGNQDVFLARFNSSGIRQWATYIGGSNSESTGGLSCDPGGNIYIQGVTDSDNNISTTGSFQITRNGDKDFYLMKFNSSGARQWGTYYGGSGYEWRGGNISVNNTGGVSLCGETQSSNISISPGAHQTTYGGNADCFLAYFNTDGQRQWATYCGGSGEDKIAQAFFDNNGNLFLAGRTTSGSSIATAGTYQSTYNGGYDGFLVKFNSSGVRQWGTYYGGSGDDVIHSVLCMNNDIIISGNTSSSNGVHTTNALQTSLAGGTDGFIARLFSDGTRNWGSYIGGNGNETWLKMTFLSTDIIGLVGMTESSNGIATIGTHQQSYGGNGDLMLIALDINPAMISTSTISPSSYCAGSSINVPFTITGTYNSGNVFTAQLSNSAGSFASPTSIGTLTSTNAGTINATIPSNTPSGTGYRVRVVSSNPSVTGTDNGANLSINPMPTPSISGQDTVCEKSLQSYTTTLTAGRTYKWTATNGTIQGADNTTNCGVLWSTGASGTIKLVETVTVSGCKDSVTKTVYFKTAPALSISGPTTVCEKNQITYSAGSSTNSYKWTATNGTIQGADNTNNVNVIWTAGAAGTLKLVEADPSSGCKDSLSQNITINPLPSLSFTGNLSPCANTGETYTLSATAGHSYKWTVTGGTIQGADNGTSVIVNWQSAGAGTVKLIQTIDATGCKDSLTKNITIGDVPTADFNGIYTVCGGKQETYTATSASGVTYLWTVSDGTINGSNTSSSVTITWNNSGNGVLTLIETNTVSGCKDTSQKNITINTKPSSSITGEQIACRGDEKTYSTSYTSSNIYKWLVTGGTLQTSDDGSSIRVLWDKEGTGEIKLAVSVNSTGCKDSTIYGIIINTKQSSCDILMAG